MNIANKISRLRTDKHLSQEKFAELFSVSKQAVQKWESGISMPDTEKLILIAKHFGISLDALIFDTDARSLNKLPDSSLIEQNFTDFSFWQIYSESLPGEYLQSYEEGKDIERYKELFSEVKKMPNSPEKEKIADILFQIAYSLPTRADYPYNEPSDYETISACREKYDFTPLPLTKKQFLQKVKGAWNGRIAGCMLGKTVECMRTDELIEFLKATDNYPMHRFIKRSDATDELCNRFKFRLKNGYFFDEHDYAQADDDLNYTVMAQLMLKSCGRDFTSKDVARAWLTYQPKDAYFTAERIAYCNLINGYTPPHSAVYKNPCREWIGAQIRADYYGYINPGNPEAAAEMAFRDASVSHVKNGIYGSMYVAAMLAAAAVSNNIKDVILSGISFVPKKSRLYEQVMKIFEMHGNKESSENCFRYIHTAYDEYQDHGWCHTVSNAMTVTAALLYGNGDFGKSICMAVETGFDTDCNGATVGSVLGMLYGAGNIGEEWTKPFNGKLKTTIFGHEYVNIENLIADTVSDAVIL